MDKHTLSYDEIKKFLDDDYYNNRVTQYKNKLCWECGQTKGSCVLYKYLYKDYFPVSLCPECKSYFMTRYVPVSIEECNAQELFVVGVLHANT